MLETQSRRRSAPIEPATNGLRRFSEVHIDEDLRGVTGTFENALFFNCTFGSLKDLKFINCVLDRSHFTETDPAQMLGFTVTLDCHSFSGVELSPEAFDLILMLLVKTSGNTEKRRAIIEKVVGHDASFKYLSKLKNLENPAHCAEG